MKRLWILSVITIVFATSTVVTAPVSFAENSLNRNTTKSTQTYNNNNKYENRYENNYEDENDFGINQHKYVQKDTSWFDYENPQDTYEISTEAELLGLASLVNENQVDKWKPTRIENFEGVTFVLKNDIKLTNKWRPIGTGSASYFAGTFDGNGHTISNLDLEMNSGLAGFFGYLVGEVKDLTVEGKITSGGGNCGGIAGLLDAEGLIKDCKTNITIKAKDKVGGIVGYNDGGTIELSINLGKVSGTYKVGGIVGENWGGKVTECGNRGEVHSSKRGVATYGTGGVAGRSVSGDARIIMSYNSGKIFSDTEATGGIVGYTNASGAAIKDCYNTGEITLKNKKNAKKIAKSYAGGIVGIIGATDITVRNCYNAAAILNADVNGGVIGYYINDTANPEEIKYLKNNYYLGGKVKSGIGLIYDQEDRNISKAASGISGMSMNGLSSSLAAAYKDDTGIYGNSGYPVLDWQKPLSDDEKVYLDSISEEKQKQLDKHLLKNAGNSQYGQTILKFFTPTNYSSDAIILYNENKEDIKK